jgi:Reverse transcriptase (RNA-dependent DNA polymerase)
MSTLMQDLKYVRAYIDDLLIITHGSFEEHIDKLKVVLGQLRDAGLKVNAKKSFFAREELEYLGYVRDESDRSILLRNDKCRSRPF